MFHQNIRLPGVYIFNGNASANKGMQGAPIFCSMPSLSIIGMNDTSDKVLVFPKYKVIFYYNSDYQGGIITTHDNTNGTKCLYQTVLTNANNASSCEVFYDGIKIENCFSTTGT